MTALLEARAVSIDIGGATLVDNVDLRIEAGEAVGIVGPNGAGKSTLLRLISGDLRAVSGAVRLKQRPRRSTPVWRSCRRRATGFSTGSCRQNSQDARPPPAGRGRRSTSSKLRRSTLMNANGTLPNCSVSGANWP